jgi:hypothetical protein
MSKYQGWHNYETWNVALWFGNDERLYKMVLRAGGERPFTPASARALTERVFPHGTPDLKSMGGAKAYAKVDWQEIADDFNEMSAHARPRALANRSRATRTRR